MVGRVHSDGMAAEMLTPDDGDLTRFVERWSELPLAGSAVRLSPSPELAALADAHPEHEIWTEQPAGVAGAVKYVAKRRPGTLASPYIVVTRDFAEFRDALG